MLSDNEITALIAHEIGHLYLGKDLAEARNTDNARLARIVELKCDVIALIILKNLNIDAAALISAVKKLVAERKKLDLEIETAHSPSMDDRVKLSAIFLKRRETRK